MLEGAEWFLIKLTPRAGRPTVTNKQEIWPPTESIATVLGLALINKIKKGTKTVDEEEENERRMEKKYPPISGNSIDSTLFSISKTLTLV